MPGHLLTGKTKPPLFKFMTRHRRAKSSEQESPVHLHLKVKGHSSEYSNIPITVLRTLPTHLQVNAPLCPGTCDPDHSPDERQLFMKASDESLRTEEAFGMRGETSLLGPYGFISPG